MVLSGDANICLAAQAKHLPRVSGSGESMDELLDKDQ